MGDVPVPIDEATPLCHHRHPPLVTVGCGPSVAPDGPERTKTSSPSLSTDTRHGHHFNLEAAGRDEHEFARFLLLDRGSSFLVPLGIATLCWAIMACPMSVLRVAMGEAGYPARLSLTAIEFHFLGMYFPGFWAGTLMDRSGVGGALALSCLSFASACGINLLLAAPPADPSFEGGDGGGGGVIPWMAGMVFLGVGWNLGFAGSTVMLSASSKAEDGGDTETARAVQAANDFLMFLLSGTAILSTGYVYEAGGRGMDGWVAVNSVALGLVGVLIAVVLLAAPR